MAALVLLTASAALGCLSFGELLAWRQDAPARDKVAATVGVTAFLSALGFMLERKGVAAVALLLLLTWLIHDTARRLDLAESSIRACAWIGMGLFFLYIATAFP